MDGIDIWKEMGSANKKRREMQMKLMEEYDRTIHIPRITELRRLCGERGHTPGQWIPNQATGGMYRICTTCMAHLDIEKDDGYAGS